MTSFERSATRLFAELLQGSETGALGPGGFIGTVFLTQRYARLQTSHPLARDEIRCRQFAPLRC